MNFKSKYMLDRLKERSTWQGFMFIGVAFGLTSEQWEALAALGVGAAAVVNVLMPEKTIESSQINIKDKF